MQVKKRYSLFNVSWMVLAVNLFFYILGLLIMTYVQVPENAGVLKKMLSAEYLFRQLLSVVFQIFFFYYATNQYNRFMVEKRNAGQYFRFSIWLMVIFFAYHLLMHYVYPEQVTSNKIDSKSTLPILILSYSFTCVLMIGVALLIAYLNNLRDEKKQRKILEAQKLQLEVDKSQANFKFLKSQINPHFLHNTLNFLYAKSLPYSAELSEGILTLSDIMRYALNEAAGSDDKAPLKDEIEHVRNVIKINQLRFSNNLNVNFEVNGVVNGAEIIPFVLITIVENAFKHGDLQKPEFPIDIKLTIDHQHLVFYCRNRKKSGPKEISTGLGLDNIRNRLDFAYGKNYTMLVKDEADFYTTELTITTL